MSKRQPHEILLNILQGPKVPKDFEDDGCSASPDWYFYWACRIHDFEYHLCRTKWWAVGKRTWKSKRKRADKNLMANIRTLTCRVVDGEVIRPFGWKMRAYFSWTRYFAVRAFGRRAARPNKSKDIE